MKPLSFLPLTNTSLMGAALAFGFSSVAAQDAMVDLGQLEALTLSGSKVVGSREGAWELPGSAAYIDADEFRLRGYTNVNRILGAVPGVYLREEDGFGNFPNISMRGADGTRAEKITVMEDGILAAPAPYAAPSAYYSPRASRMAGLEILKGSSQIKYGPQTTAGVINYLSTPIPEELGAPNFYWRSTYGSHNTFFNHAYYGDTVQTKNGKFGFLFELYHETSEGFRKLDGGGDTGFTTYEPMVKFFWEPDTVLKQRIEFKYGYTELDADETYVGLSEVDFAASPYRRYAGTQFDNMDTHANRSYLKWMVEPSDDFSFETALYYNNFSRNWYKVRGIDVTVPADVAFLNGSAAATLTDGLRANARDYEACGIQFSALYEFETGALEHDFEFGARLHYDDIQRFQRDDDLLSLGTGPGGFSVTPGAPGSGGNRFESSKSLSLWVTDQIDFGKWSISPGFRYEYMDLDNTDYFSDASFTQAADRRGHETYFAPGMGFTYDINDDNKLFGGVFKGYSIAGPRSILNSGVRKEESLGYELGARHRGKGVTAELVGFLTDYDNLISTSAGLGLAGNENVGAAEVFGLEALVSYDLGEESGFGYGLPMYLSATWTSAELKGPSLSSGGGDDIYEGGGDGSDIPYVPEWKLAAGVGVVFEKWGANLDMTYASSMYGTASNFNSPVTDQKQGKLESVLLFDLSAHYEMTENLKLLGGIQNLTDEEYITSRMPLGPRAGAPRSIFGGFEMTF
ncbi:MAG: TonB-dependent receptor family protein [Luteolibacter sp.]